MLILDLLDFIKYRLRGSVYYTWGAGNTRLVVRGRRRALRDLACRAKALAERADFEDDLSDCESDDRPTLCRP